VIKPKDENILSGDVWRQRTNPSVTVTVLDQNDRKISFVRGDSVVKVTCKREDFLQTFELSHRTKRWNPARSEG